MADVLKVLRKVEGRLVSYFQGSEAWAKRHGLEVVGDVEGGAAVAEQEARTIVVNASGVSQDVLSEAKRVGVQVESTLKDADNEFVLDEAKAKAAIDAVAQARGAQAVPSETAAEVADGSPTVESAPEVKE